MNTSETLYDWMKDRFAERQIEKLFCILSKRYNTIFNKEYPGDLESIKKIGRGEVKPNPREKWNQLLQSLKIEMIEDPLTRSDGTVIKPFKEGYVSVRDPGPNWFVLIPLDLAGKILVLGNLP